MPASTFETAGAEGCVVLLVVLVARLTLVRRSRLLGRNLITVFSAVNNLSQKNSARPPSRPASPAARDARDTDDSCAGDCPPKAPHIPRRAKKRRVLCSLSARRATAALQSRTRRARCAQRCGRRRWTLNHVAAGGRDASADCASQQPDCAKVRKNFRARAAAATAVRRRRGDSTTRFAGDANASPHPLRRPRTQRRVVAADGGIAGHQAFAPPQNKSGRTGRPDRNDGDAGPLSGLLPRAARHRRPGRAVR